MIAPLLALALAAPCPDALAAAGALGDAELALRAPALAAALGPKEAAEARALREEALAATAAEPAGRQAAGARFRAALTRHCALLAQPRLPRADAATRARAAAILEQPAFRAARADRAAALRWLRALWQRLLDLLETGQAQEYAAFSRTLFLVAVAVAAALGLAALRRRRAEAPRRLRPAPEASTSGPEDPRLDAARQAAARGDAGAAVRLALLAALAALERDGAVPRGRSFTNGELIELLRASPARRGPAGDLARIFDRAVYGGLPAGPVEAAAAIEAARALGAGGAAARRPEAVP